MINLKSLKAAKFNAQSIQKFGRFLSGMVMPNIGAFIAWGLLTALFVPNGWWPDESLAELVQPMIFYLLPLLIGFTGGKIIYGERGGVLGAVATMGMIVSTTIPMFAGAMIVGPLAGWTIKQVDLILKKQIPSGFEMITNNFSAGIVGAILAVSCFLIVGPIVEFLDDELGIFVEFIINAGVLPLISIFVEPAKILFLNNAINHGVFSNLGIGQAIETGKSIFFLIETNPGPGLGILLVYFYFTKGIMKQTAPGAILIHFFGGIHEIYFPYVLMQPKLILAVIAGGMSGVFTFLFFDAGLIAVPSPGSILTYIAMSPKGGLLPVLSGVVVSTVVTFFVGALLVNRDVENNQEELADVKEAVMDLKGSKVHINYDHLPDDLDKDISLIAVACDAGMGSSVMGANHLARVFEKAGITTEVIHCPIDELTSDIDLVITHELLTTRAANCLPSAIHIAIRDFINTPVYDNLAQYLIARNQDETFEQKRMEQTKPAESVLIKRNIRIEHQSLSKNEAIELAGSLLHSSAYVEKPYINAMIERDNDVSTFIGHGVAIPHGTRESRSYINKTGISIVYFPNGIDFSGDTVHFVFGIAAIGDEHLTVLSKLAEILDDNEAMHSLKQSCDQESLLKHFSIFTHDVPETTHETSLVIFDCDGVLVDSEIISANILIDYLDTLGIQIDFEHVQKRYLGRSFTFLEKDLRETFDVDLPDDLEQQYRERLLVAFKNDLQPISGISNVLQNLSVDFCIASSSSKKRIHNSLKYTSLSEWFSEGVFSGDEVENGKPAPDLFLYAAKSMGHKPENCLVLEDSPSGIKAGIAANMEVIHFVGGSHLQSIEHSKIMSKDKEITVINNWTEFFDIKPKLKRE